MHQKHKVPNYCSQLCYGQVKSGKNENFSRSGKSQGRSLTLSKPGGGGGYCHIRAIFSIPSVILREDLTKIPEHYISNFDPLGKGKLPQSQVLPDASILS